MLRVGIAQAELPVEDPRELVVVVLAGVRHDELKVLRELRVEGRRLDELRARPGDGEQAHRREGTRIGRRKSPGLAGVPI